VNQELVPVFVPDSLAQLLQRSRGTQMGRDVAVDQSTAAMLDYHNHTYSRRNVAVTATKKSQAALERAAKEIERTLGVGIDVVGFDSGEGMPEPTDYRDWPHIWGRGFYHGAASSAPRIRVYPQEGFSSARRRMRSIIVFMTRGRPGLRRWL
jgi:hypothetical protein